MVQPRKINFTQTVGTRTALNNASGSCLNVSLTGCSSITFLCSSNLVKVFRMLGSDPIYQYETEMGDTIQRSITLEPVYGDAGGCEKWVRRFFKSIFEDPCIGFNYTLGKLFYLGWYGKRIGNSIPYS